MSNIMINPLFMQNIPEEKKELVHNNMLNDIYFLYHNIKPTSEHHIVQLDGNIYNLSKDNLFLVLSTSVKPN